MADRAWSRVDEIRRIIGTRRAYLRTSERSDRSRALPENPDIQQFECSVFNLGYMSPKT